MTSVEHSYLGVTGLVADELVRAEAAHHRAGWGGMPVTFHRVSQRAENGFLVVNGARLGLRGRDPRLTLQLMNTGRDAYAVADFAREKNAPVAHMLVFEPWRLDGLAQNPGTESIRVAHAALADQVITLVRRGEGAPSFYDPFSDPGGVDGVLLGLHQCVSAYWRDNAPS